MTKPQVSIIIPVYNAESFIHRCVDSVLRQNNTEFELLLIDDGSKDKSGAICDEYAQKDPRVKVFHKENGGVSTARNLGIDKSTGEWITFIDADDWVEPNFLNDIGNLNDNQIDWVFAEWRTVWDRVHLNEINEYEDKVLFCNRQEIDEMWNKMANLDIFRCPWGKFFRLSIIRENNLYFDQELRYGEDTVFNYEYLTHCNCIKLSKEENAHYIFHQIEGTVAVSKYKCSAEGIISARDKVFSIYFDRGYNNNKFERLFFFGFTMIEKLYLGKKDNEQRKQYYHSPIQQEIEKRCLNEIKNYDKFMYLLFKKLPHSVLSPIAKIYLQYR